MMGQKIASGPHLAPIAGDPPLPELSCCRWEHRWALWGLSEGWSIPRFTPYSLPHSSSCSAPVTLSPSALTSALAPSGWSSPVAIFTSRIAQAKRGSPCVPASARQLSLPPMSLPALVPAALNAHPPPPEPCSEPPCRPPQPRYLPPASFPCGLGDPEGPIQARPPCCCLLRCQHSL